MRYTTDATHCPQCGHLYLARRKRALWMRLIGVSKHYRCENCKCRLLFRESKSSKDTAKSNS